MTAYLPSTLHLSPLLSSCSASSFSTPTTTSALLVLRLNKGKDPASGPGKNIQVSICYRGSSLLPTAEANGVQAGQRTSPVNLAVYWVIVIEKSTRLTCDSLQRALMVNVLLWMNQRSLEVSLDHHHYSSKSVDPKLMLSPTLKITKSLAVNDRNSSCARSFICQNGHGVVQNSALTVIPPRSPPSAVSIGTERLKTPWSM